MEQMLFNEPEPGLQYVDSWGHLEVFQDAFTYPQAPPPSPPPVIMPPDFEHLLMVSESRLIKKIEDLEKKIDSFSFKQVKRKRTVVNRCKALNRKGETCNGFCCKNKSSHLCYAHYVLLNKHKEQASYLYHSK